MELKELAKLCENLSLTDEDSEIHQVFGGIENEGVKDVHHCLVGKVLSSRRVNREAFKTIIEQIWSPFGTVDIEAVGKNTFLFYFANPEDRNRIWRRGPWHFDRHLLALEKLEGTGNISQLSFSKAEFWVQIHDIPIMCMNRCMAKWLAAQIGDIIEIPSKSRECWGKFLRVKVLIDISRPLKRWLRLKLDQSDNIVMVNLKYERLPEFCYACGRLGHSIGDCNDVEAKKAAVEGPITKFGSWMRASLQDKIQVKASSMSSGGSSDKERSLGESSGRDSDESSKKHMASFDFLKGRSGCSKTASSLKDREVLLERSNLVKPSKIERKENMCVDGPLSGQIVEVMVEAQEVKKDAIVDQNTSLVTAEFGSVSGQTEKAQCNTSGRPEISNQSLSLGLAEVKVPLIKGKKWKRMARETKGTSTTDMTWAGRS
ncbi:hypothetical protein EZV62_024379 [Acer yangbiense]|uniref:CCHC-type domain-containing protein n=1 Tax=Acer yangbiense TaxID=1000413 RepID=A0A5C7GUN2_9ROSI|nr:hypothetical protein EZV62_024379 [Acer yangbiense]